MIVDPLKHVQKNFEVILSLGSQIIRFLIFPFIKNVLDLNEVAFG